MKLAIKKGDTVQVVAGADKGSKGSVLSIDKKKLRILVSGVRMRTHFDKDEGILKKEGFISYSNVKLVSAAKAEPKKKAAKK